MSMLFFFGENENEEGTFRRTRKQAHLEDLRQQVVRIIVNDSDMPIYHLPCDHNNMLFRFENEITVRNVPLNFSKHHLVLIVSTNSNIEHEFIM